MPVHKPTTDTQVSPDEPLQLPAKVSVPTPIPGAASDGKKLATTGSDGTLLYAGAGTVLLLQRRGRGGLHPPSPHLLLRRRPRHRAVSP